VYTLKSTQLFLFKFFTLLTPQHKFFLLQKEKLNYISVQIKSAQAFEFYQKLFSHVYTQHTLYFSVFSNLSFEGCIFLFIWTSLLVSNFVEFWSQYLFVPFVKGSYRVSQSHLFYSIKDAQLNLKKKTLEMDIKILSLN